MLAAIYIHIVDISVLYVTFTFVSCADPSRISCYGVYLHGTIVETTVGQASLTLAKTSRTMGLLCV